MGRKLDDKFMKNELKTREAIRITRECLCFSSGEIENLCNIYGEIARTKNAGEIFSRMRSSESGLKELELWKNFQGVVGKNYDGSISYQEFMGRVLDLNEKKWGNFWYSGERESVPY